MTTKVWKPNVTVAAIVEREGRFLLVEEETDHGLMLNQPAGHLEPNESLVAGAAREALEETAYEFTPEYLVGVYRWRHPYGNVTYLRFAFAGSLGTHHPERALDTGIVRALWLTAAEVHASHGRHRSPLVVRCMEDYQRGARAPLDLLVHLD
ncbi:MAG TPA: NUDIX hydrolase [Burkholderiales bacterium]|jgi:8-oxo-dGTP pyrophosphatase MutT (NUDIX family)|nr:NUDIX hydrolase [Burkholderiales bacterium]